MPEKYCEISESAEELLNMIKKEKKGRFRLRRLLKTGEAETVIHAAELCGISTFTEAERFCRCETGGISGTPFSQDSSGAEPCCFP